MVFQLYGRERENERYTIHITHAMYIEHIHFMRSVQSESDDAVVGTYIFWVCEKR